MLLSHIVGLNNLIKKDFLEFCKEHDDKLIVEDIDEISKLVMDDDNYVNLLNKYNSPNSIGKRKDILHEMSLIWKNKMETEIANILKLNEQQNIILIGLSNYVMDQRIKIDIPTKNLFFINTDPLLNSKQIITYNIDNFRKEIIDGKFPLDYIDTKFLTHQREMLREIYLMRGYSLKKYDSVISWIKDKISDTQADKVYYASFKRHDDVVNSYDKLTGYPNKWLAIASLLPRSDVKRIVSYKDKIIPIIKETQINAFSKFKKPCYIYEFNSTNKIDEFRYVINETVPHIFTYENRHYVSDAFDELVRAGVKMEKFTYDNDT